MKNGIPETDGVIEMLTIGNKRCQTFQAALDSIRRYGHHSAQYGHVVSGATRVRVTVECGGDTRWLLARDAGPHYGKPVTAEQVASDWGAADEQPC